MNKNNMLDILDRVFLQENQNSKLLINGKWGIGKTHSFREFLKKSHLRVIYISLFGVSSINQINKSIKMQYIRLSDEQFGKAASAVEKFKETGIGKLLNQVIEKKTGISFDFLDLVDIALDDRYLLCFDDIERKSPNISMTDLLGLIEQVSSETKVLLIAYEDKIPTSDREKFREFKEKVVDREFVIDSIHEHVLRIMYEKTQLDPSYFLSVKRIFDLSGKSNLRVFRKMLNLIKSVSLASPLNNELVELCSIIVVEDIIGDIDLREVIDGEEGSLFENTICTRYKLTLDLYPVFYELYQYHKTHQMNVEVLNHFVNPQYHNDYHKVCEYIFNPIYGNKQRYMESLSYVTKKFYDLDIAFFPNVYSIYSLIHTIKHNKSFWGFPADSIIAKLEDKALELIAKIVSFQMNLEEKQNELKSFKVRKGDEFVNRIRDLVSTSILISLRDRFREKFWTGQYSDCLDLLKNHPQILIDVSYLFDELKKEECRKDYLMFLYGVSRFIRDEDRDLICHKLSTFIYSHNDPIIRERIKNVLDKIEKRTTLSFN